MSRTAIIVGSAGQDGTLLKSLLTSRNYRVVGISRDGAHCGQREFDRMNFDIRDGIAVAALVRDIKPDEIYFLAAYHHSSQDQTEDDATLFLKSQEIHVTAFLHFVEAARRHANHVRIFYAASSHVFGSPDEPLQDEATPIRPESPYAITKAAGLFICRYYREKRGMFISAGILYNHESPLRGTQFISRKLARAAVQIKRGLLTTVTIGDLDAAADWGYAPDYVDAMQRILGLDRPDTFVVATGQRHTVRDMAAAAFEAVGLDYGRYVKTDTSLLQRSTSRLVGNPAKLKREAGWKPSIGFSEMMVRLVQAEMDRTDE